jgi:hypothetical protein
MTTFRAGLGAIILTLAGALDRAEAISARSRRRVSEGSSTIAPRTAAHRAYASGNSTRIPSFSRIDRADSWMCVTSSSESTRSGSNGFRSRRWLWKLVVPVPLARLHGPAAAIDFAANPW